jgi:hypothetical protein
MEDHVYLVFDAAGSRPSLLSAPTLLRFARHQNELIEPPYRPIGEAEGSGLRLPARDNPLRSHFNKSD